MGEWGTRPSYWFRGGTRSVAVANALVAVATESACYTSGTQLCFQGMGEGAGRLNIL